MNSFQVLLLTVGLTLAFEFSNGWHDAANSIATVVSTRVLTPFRAVVWAAFWNFIAAFVFGTAVAKTLGSGMVHIDMVNQRVLLAGLVGAILWNMITLILGLPTSSSHALMGGYGGAAVAHAGLTALILSGWTKPICSSPVAGDWDVLGFARGFRRPRKLGRSKDAGGGPGPRQESAPLPRLAREWIAAQSADREIGGARGPSAEPAWRDTLRAT